ncbi:hypothetical protein ACFQ7N_19275 [Streptomyces niveus]|uniref:hypothetical protein n=1 Tax=Streptomyces niveus TaxID=193462 RepID=UPI0036327D67
MSSWATAPTGDHHDDQAAPHGVDDPDRDTARTPGRRGAAVHAHQHAAMPQEYLEGRTTDSATWLHTPENLNRLAALTKAADARRRAVADRPEPDHPEQRDDVVGPADQQHHTSRPDQGRAPGRDR